MPRIYKRAVSICHPSKPHGGYGLCKRCYAKKFKPVDYHLRYKLRTVYGMTLEQYDAMVAQLGGKCPLCDGYPNTASKYTDRLVIDHDHKTGKVRGLLCHTCNRMLAWIENEEWLAKAQAYLDLHK